MGILVYDTEFHGVQSECTPHESREPSGDDQETNEKADSKVMDLITAYFFYAILYSSSTGFFILITVDNMEGYMVSFTHLNVHKKLKLMLWRS